MSYIIYLYIYLSIYLCQRFARERVLLIDGGGEFGESAGAQRGSRPCTVHEVIDRAIENAVDEDYVFQAPTEEDDEVGRGHGRGHGHFKSLLLIVNAGLVRRNAG